jgi:hypothetical protein
MLIAVLALLGVDLIVIVAFTAFVASRRRWVSRQPGAFRGAIRIAGGAVEVFGPKWRRGYGRWVQDVLVWTKGPFLFRNELLATDGMDAQRRLRPGEVKRLGNSPVVVRLRVGTAAAEVAAGSDDSSRLLGPYSKAPAATVTPGSAPPSDPTG